MKNQDRLTIRIDADMRAKLHERAGALGLDDAAYVRMLIYSEVNDGCARPGDSGAGDAAFFARPRPVAGRDVGYSGRDQGLSAEEAAIEADEPRAEEVDVPPDADGGIPLDALLGAGPSILDEMMAAGPAPQPVARPAAPTYRSALPQRAARQQSRPQVWGAFGNAYSMTRPVGVNGTAIGENAMGDGRGNVQRANMGHFVRAR